MMIRIRQWLIDKLAQDMAIVMNVGINENGAAIHITNHNHGGLVKNCRIYGSSPRRQSLFDRLRRIWWHIRHPDFECG